VCDRPAVAQCGPWSGYDLSWDTRVVYIQRHQRWWWNAWLAATDTELFGFADSQEAAYRAMQVAIREAGSAAPPDRGDAR
jgi:hypothetical protein